jgi:hypothetical protein
MCISCLSSLWVSQNKTSRIELRLIAKFHTYSSRVYEIKTPTETDTHRAKWLLYYSSRIKNKSIVLPTKCIFVSYMVQKQRVLSYKYLGLHKVGIFIGCEVQLNCWAISTN